MQNRDLKEFAGFSSRCEERDLIDEIDFEEFF